MNSSSISSGILVSFVLTSLSAVALLGASPASASNKPLMPPGNVYTCPWIAAHPVEAELAQVSCDPGDFMSSSLPASALAGDSFSPLEDGEGWVPSSGYIGQGVFAWTSYKYTVYWAWFPDVSFSTWDYTWYVQKPGNITKVFGHIVDAGVSHNSGIISANNHRWGVQNHVDGPRRWYLTWHD
jgi:hypothetical protein